MVNGQWLMVNLKKLDISAEIPALNKTNY